MQTRASLLGVLVLLGATGCANSHSSSQAVSAVRETRASVMLPGPGEVRVGGGRIKWNRLADGRVCFGATWPEYDPHFGTTPADCMRHLRADEITFVVRKARSGRQIIAGLKGPRVRAVRVRLLYPARTWSPANQGSAFFGYVPSGTMTAVVKLLDDGTTKAFPFHAVSKS